jgi:hypothetical protein
MLENWSTGISGHLLLRNLKEGNEAVQEDIKKT